VLAASFLSLMPPGRREGVAELLATLRPDHAVVTWEHDLPDGGWEQWRVRAFHDGGELIGHQAVGRDVTDRRKAEEEHRLLEAQRTLAEVLRETDRRKDEFIAVLAHELRNPLAPISMVAEILRRKASPDEDVVWARGVLARQVAQLTRLVDDLLDVSRIERGSFQLQSDTVDLARVVATAVETTRPQVTAAQLELAVELPHQPLLVRGDANRLVQMLSNLLHNAAKYTAPGGGVALKVERSRTEIAVYVRDTGIGIAPDMLKRIFEPFVQADRSRDGGLGGLGLGLALVERLARMHGGTAEAHSGGPGLGSEFVVRLPALDGTAPGDAALPADDPRLDGLRVLVVDDATDAADGLARFLVLQGCQVHVVNDGASGVDAARRLSPDVVFLDLGMPGLDGLEVARRLRRQHPRESMLLVATTGFGQHEDRRRTTEAGFDRHLTKPVDAAAVREILAGWRNRPRATA
jgi:signal transduction histidine kinase